MTVVTICLPHYTMGSTSSRAVYFGSPSPQVSPRAQQCELNERVNIVYGQKENDEYGEVGLPCPHTGFSHLARFTSAHADVGRLVGEQVRKPDRTGSSP